MRLFKSSRLGLLLLVLLLSVTPARGAQDIFLDLPDIQGESVDAEFRDKIVVLSGSFGAANPACTGATGMPAASEFVFTKFTDKATVKMFEALRDRTTFTPAVMSFRREALDPLVYQEYEFTNAILTSGSVVGTSSDERNIESWSVAFSQVIVRYTPTNAAGDPLEPLEVTITPAACGGS